MRVHARDDRLQRRGVEEVDAGRLAGGREGRCGRLAHQLRRVGTPGQELL